MNIRTRSLTGLCLIGVIMDAGAREPVTFYEDILPVVEANCVTCHAEQSVSFSFEDPETAYEFRVAMAAAVGARRMPPWIAEAGHQEYVGDYSLNEADVALFAAWAEAGFPRGEAGAARHRQQIAPEFEPQLTLEVQPDFSYLPNQTRKDDYRCFLVDWPYEETRYVTGFRARPGNLRVAHHLVLFAVPPESAGFLRMLSEAEEGPGHQCFGGVMPDKVAGDRAAREALEAEYPGAWRKTVNDYYWLSHWAPGVVGFEFPEDTGVRVEPGTVLVVQMHYYSAYAPGETDGNTLMEFRVEDSVRKPSINYPMTNNEWLYATHNQSMVIPPGEARTYETSVTFADIARRASRVLEVDEAEISAIELRSANLHMHAFGASGEVSLHHASGEKETLLNIPEWDLDWQRDFEFTRAKPVPASTFDRTRLEVECTFENYSDDTVVGGYGSYDEMCFNFSYVSIVRDEAPLTRAAAPSVGDLTVASP